MKQHNDSITKLHLEGGGGVKIPNHKLSQNYAEAPAIDQQRFYNMFYLKI